MDTKVTQGINYPLSLLQKADYSQALFWLGIKPLDFKCLHELLNHLTNNRLIDIISDLQDHYLISPIKEAGHFTLTDAGYEFARLITMMGVWGRQQMDANAGIALQRVILPDAAMPQQELLKYRDEMSRYF